MPMTVDLGDLTPTVDRLVASGRYPSREAVLRLAVQLVAEREAERDALLAELQEGVDDLDAGRSYSVEETEAELKARREARAAARAA